jgi:aldehyde:ferredoxin oxidoreductase
MALLNATTGANSSLEELEIAGERIFNAERLFINRAGVDRKQDALPPRMTAEPMPAGPWKDLPSGGDTGCLLPVQGMDTEWHSNRRKISRAGADTDRLMHLSSQGI